MKKDPTLNCRISKEICMNEHERRGREIKFNDFDVLRCDSKKQIFLYFTVSFDSFLASFILKIIMCVDKYVSG